MTCKDLIEFLAEYLDGGLPPSQRAAFERHIGLCRACADYLAAYRQTIRVVHATSQITGRCAPPPLPEGLVTAITSAARVSTR